ncbi:unnamed protein product, partial [Mesorhabditis spiculigera]
MPAEEKLLKQMTPNKIDDLLNLGRYSLLVCIACELIVLMQAGNLLFMVFGGAPPQLTGCRNVSIATGLTGQQKEAAVCRARNSTDCLVEWDPAFRSVNVEFNYICEDSALIKDSTSIQMPMLISVCLTGLFGTLAAFANSLTLFTFLRFLTIFFNTGHVVIVVVYMCETLPTRHRMWLNFVINWSPNILLVTVLAWWLGEWRSLELTLNLLSIPIVILLFFSEESVYWLVREAAADYRWQRLGRMTAHYIFAGYATFAVLAIIGLQLIDADKSLAEVVLVITASSMASQIFLTNQVTCSEIYPTPIRNIAYAMTQLSGSTGSVFGVQLFKLKSISPSLPYAVMTLIIILETSLFFFFIPESKGQPLVETMPSKDLSIAKTCSRIRTGEDAEKAEKSP